MMHSLLKRVNKPFTIQTLQMVIDIHDIQSQSILCHALTRNEFQSTFSPVVTLELVLYALA